MMRLQHIVRSALCCLLCLTVCVVPALAGMATAAEYVFNGFLAAPLELWKYSNGNSVIYPFDGSFSATFTVNNLEENNGLRLEGDSLGVLNGYKYSTDGGYIDIVFNLIEPTKLSTTQGNGSFAHLLKDTVSGGTISHKRFSRASFFWDDNYQELEMSGVEFVMPAGDWPIMRYFGWRFYFDSYNSASAITNPNPVIPVMTLYCNSVFGSLGTLNGDAHIVDSIDATTSVMREINGTLVEVKNTVTVMQSDLSEIKGGLQDSNSSIWGAFKDSVSELFVPSYADLVGVMGGFDQLVQDKLGGAYQTVGLVNNGVQSVVNKFKNPGSNPGVEFPGISVPLGGDVGTVTLAASQTVTIPEEITNVLYPVSGVIIPIVCVIWTIRQCTDMVECFMSGMSYAEFLHRNSDEEDEEV